MLSRLRRLATFLIALLAVQLALPAAGAACAMAASTTSDEVAHHAPAPHDGHDATSDAPTRAPSHHGGVHCPAAVGCATAIVAAQPVMTPGVERTLAATLAPPPFVAPARPLGAPEPPPPRS